MGSLFSTPKVTPLTPTPAASQSVNKTVSGVQNSTSLAAKLEGGLGSTMLTGSNGLSQTGTGSAKTLLGG